MIRIAAKDRPSPTDHLSRIPLTKLSVGPTIRGRVFRPVGEVMVAKNYARQTIPWCNNLFLRPQCTASRPINVRLLSRKRPCGIHTMIYADETAAIHSYYVLRIYEIVKRGLVEACEIRIHLRLGNRRKEDSDIPAEKFHREPYE